MTFITVFNEIAILFILILAGYVARKLNYINEVICKGLSVLVLQFALPALIIKSMQFSFSREVLLASLHILFLSTIVHGISIIIAFLYAKLFKVTGGKRDIFQFILVFSNVGYMGYPVLYAIYGELGVFYGALYNIPFNVLLWTLGVFFMTRGKKEEVHKINYKKLMLNPGIISVFIGFMLFMLSIELPYVLFRTLDLLGSTTTPLSMLVIGGMLAEIPFNEVFKEKRIIEVSIIRLIITPMVVLLFLKGYGATGLLLGVPVIISAMPAAANTAVFASMFNTEPRLASKGVFITTLLSMITIPLLTLLIKL